MIAPEGIALFKEPSHTWQVPIGAAVQLASLFDAEVGALLRILATAIGATRVLEKRVFSGGLPS